MYRLTILFVIFMLILGCEQNPGDDSASNENNPDKVVMEPENNASNEEPILEVIAWGNTKCPVMPDEDIDEEISIDFEGKTLYLCCKKCKKKFTDDPAKYRDALVKMTQE